MTAKKASLCCPAGAQHRCRGGDAAVGFDKEWATSSFLEKLQESAACSTWEPSCSTICLALLQLQREGNSASLWAQHNQCFTSAFNCCCQGGDLSHQCSSLVFLQGLEHSWGAVSVGSELCAVLKQEAWKKGLLVLETASLKPTSVAPWLRVLIFQAHFWN